MKQWLNRVRVSPIWIGIGVKAGKLVALFKLVKFASIFITATSMLISVVAYSFYSGPVFALSLVGMLFIHEIGHTIAFVRKGYPLKLPIFIPFVGAFIHASDLGSRDTEAYVGYGGPFVGSIAALACTVAWWLTQSKVLLFAAFFGVYLNLFNMIPVRPLDGGRVLQIMGPRVGQCCIVAAIFGTLYWHQPQLILIWILALVELRLPIWWGTAIAIGLDIALVVLVRMGFGPPILWINLADLALCLLFTTLVANIDWMRMQNVRINLRLARLRAEIGERYNLPPPQPAILTDDRPYPPWSGRLVWLINYVGLTSILGVVMWYLVQVMPK